MSDFLDMLLARNYASLPSDLRPRPLARYELPEPIEQTSEAPTSTSVPVQPATQSAAPMPAHQQIPAVQSVSPIQELITTRELLTIRDVQHDQPDTPSPTHDRLVQTAVVPAPAQHQFVKPSAPQPAPEVGAPEHTSAVVVEEHVMRPMPVQPLLPLPPRAAPALPVQPARTSQPRVEVRIGRIELHAPAQPAAPTPASTPRTAPPVVRPVRSLDDYLRGRNGKR